MAKRFEGRRVAVVGGSSGIGRAVALALAREGAEVSVVARGRQRLAEVEAEGEGAVRGHPLDFVDEAALEAFFAGQGSLDHVVVTAAAAAMGTLRELPTADARAFLDGKLWGQYLTARHAAPVLAPNGSLTLFSGAASRRVLPGFALGAGINAAIEAIAAAIALELAPVRVNAIAPGLVDTPIWESLLPDPETRRQTLGIAASLPAGRPARPEEIADAVLFVMGNSYVTGQTLVVDGGFVHGLGIAR